jgi:phenylacetate-CoA ligase
MNHLLFKVLSKFRNPNLWKVYDELKRSESLTKEQLREIQSNKLREILIFAQNYSPFWKKVFDTHKISVTNEDPFHVLKKIPPIDKSSLILNNSDIHTQYKFNKTFKAKTSGTTGASLSFYKNELWDSYNRASIFRGYSWYNVKPWDFNFYFWGLNLSLKKRLTLKTFDFFLNRRRIFSYHNKDFESLLRSKAYPRYIEGYSSSIYEFAKYTLSNNKTRTFSKLKLVKGTSETILPHYHEIVEKAFGVGFTNEYGSAEAGIIGFSCPYGNMHINVESVVVEEHNGEAIVTNLNSKSFPILRYQQGDIIEVDSKIKCKCGLSHPIIKSVKGRVGSVIHGKKSTYPSLLLYNVFKNINGKYDMSISYQAIQKLKGHLTVKIDQKPNDFLDKIIQSEFKKYTDMDLEIDIEELIINGKSSKFRDFISKL